MIIYYFKIAWRNLSKHKLFSFINIFGLASGMTVCLLALIKIKDAYDYDTFHPHSNRTYRIITNLITKDGEERLYASSPLPLSHYLKNNYQAIDKSSSVYFTYEEISVNDKKLSAKEAYVDPDFYEIFGFKLLSGSPATRPQTVLLSLQTAERFFGKENPIGQTITIGKSVHFLVTGVLEQPPFPSHLKFDLLASTSSLPILRHDKVASDWMDESAAYTYVQLKANASSGMLNDVLKNVTQHVNVILPANSEKKLAFDLQPLNKIAPGTKPMYNLTAEPIAPNLIAFALIGLVMILLAFFNYINLTLARSLDRAREVGIRKVAGARKYDLLLQFFSESVLVAILAFCLAQFLLSMIGALPTVHNMIDDSSWNRTLWIYFIVFTVLTGVIAGWIPAKVLSASQPVRVLKGKFNLLLFGGVGLRKTLTVIQFAASLIAIVTLLVFYRQSIFMATSDYGFVRERILNIQLSDQTYETATSTFSSIPGIEQVSGTSELFGFSAGEIKFIKRERMSDSLKAFYFSVTPSHINILGIPLVAGENLPAANSTKGSHFVLINEEASRRLQFKNPHEATGKMIWLNDSTQYIVSGVVKDFHYATFLQPIQPLLLINNPDQFKILNLKVAKGAEPTIITSLEKTWKKWYPHQPFEVDWYDKLLYDRHLHKDDLMFIGLLTMMALTIACLGLLGMVIYTTKNRAKEMGIRKVMGAKVRQVILETSKEFIGLLLLSIAVGLPIGFFAGTQFLQQYAYRIPIDFGILAVSGTALLCLGGLTIGWQTYLTAIANPIKSLRTE